MTSLRHIVLTGCTRGLGLALVRPFVESGHSLSGCGRSVQIIDQLKKTHTRQAGFTVLDVSDDAAGAFSSPVDWAVQAAPFFLSSNRSHNGQSLTVPG